MTQGILIAIEGIDGAGKTTQVQLIREFLEAHGQQCVTSKEPTDGQWGRAIRATAASGRLPLEDELELFVKDRKEHIAQLINPALNDDKIVILDRYFYSTIAYQGSRGAAWKRGEQMMDFALVPDATIILDAETGITLDRIRDGRGEQPNEFEKQSSLDLCRKVFRSLGHRPEVHFVDATNSVENVQASILQILLDGPLKAKRCGKQYGCDGLYCSLRQSSTCQWALLQEAAPQRI